MLQLDFHKCYIDQRSFSFGRSNQGQQVPVTQALFGRQFSLRSKPQLMHKVPTPSLPSSCFTRRLLHSATLQNRSQANPSFLSHNPCRSPCCLSHHLFLPLNTRAGDGNEANERNEAPQTCRGPFSARDATRVPHIFKNEGGGESPRP